MKSIFKTLLVSALFVFSAAQAQELKIGFVNLDRVLRDATPAKQAQTKIDAEASKREKELAELAAKLKAASDRYDKDSPTLSESDRVRRQRELIDQDRELQRRRREVQEDLNQRRNEELSAVIDRANKVVKQIFDQEKFDLILQEVVFASNRVDITDKVIKALNNGPSK